MIIFESIFIWYHGLYFVVGLRKNSIYQSVRYPNVYLITLRRLWSDATHVWMLYRIWYVGHLFLVYKTFFQPIFERTVVPRLHMVIQSNTRANISRIEGQKFDTPK